jgi:hypothetical protein
MRPIATTIVLAAIVCSGCASSFKRTGYAAATQKASVDCPVVFKQQVQVQDDVDILGTVKASDTGFSVKCDEAYVLRRFRDDACAIGADVVSLSEERAPDFWSTCYQATATFLRYRDREIARSLTSDARYDPAPLRERSEVTYDRLRNAIIGGAIAGPVGATVGGAIP